MVCPQGAQCGTVMRPLDPSGVTPGELPIRWWLFPHRGPTKLGVIVAQEGGPGYPSTDSSFGYLMMLEPLRNEYDILMVNARGTGASAISCPSLDTHPVRTPDDVGECGRLLGPKSVLYGTQLAVHDMKAVLDSLGITQISLYGDSYGTFFSQVFVAHYPKMLRAVVLDGTFPVIGQSPWYPENADVVHTGFNAVCQRDPYCSTLPGTSLDRIRRLVNFVHAGPITGTAPDAEGTMRTVTVDPGSVGLLLYGGSGPIIYRDLDAASRAFFDRGDKQPLLRLVSEVWSDFDPGNVKNFSYGLFAAVSCMDYQQIYDMNSHVGERQAQRRAAIEAQRQAQPDFYDPLGYAEFLTVPIDTGVIDLCLKWPVQHPPYPPGQPIPAGMPFTSAPTLVINGELDTLTAPGGGAIVAAQFPNAQHIVMANSFHVDAIYDTDGCASAIVRRFLATLDAGDTSCAQQVRPIRMVAFFPRRGNDAIPAIAKATNTARPQDLALASAAVQTLGDVIARWYINFSGKGVGLHGGRWEYTGRALVPNFTLHNVRWTEDLEVSGTAVWNGNNGGVSANLTWQNAQGETAQVVVQWNERETHAVAQIQGTIADRVIRATMPAP